MKKIFFCSLLMATLLPAPLSAWNGIGHASIAQIAESHLTGKARRTIEKYLDGESLASVASDADKYRKVWLRDIGQEISNPGALRLPTWKDFDQNLPTNIEPYSHSFTVDKDFNCLDYCIKDGKYYVNSVLEAEALIEELKNGAKTMDPEERSIKIRLVIHLLGDMHCPGHIGYQVKELKGGSIIPITVGTKKTTLHKFWDTYIFKMGFPGMGFEEVAELADVATKKEIKEITSGSIRDWAHDNAISALPGRTYGGNVKMPKGQVLPESYVYDMKPLCLSQIRKGGYRLAKVLNDIFGK